MIELAVTLGIILSLFFLEAFGLGAGGIVVPGYIALQLTYPDRIIGTILITFITYLCMMGLKEYIFLFGRRQMVVALLIGTIFSII